MKRLHTKLIRLAVVVSCGVSLLSCSSDYEYSYLYRELPFEMEDIHNPHIQPRTVNDGSAVIIVDMAVSGAPTYRTGLQFRLKQFHVGVKKRF